MPEVRLFNPARANPRKKKPWTYDQAASRKDQAERFTRDVLEDDDRANEIAGMSAEEYAAERGKEINPKLGGTTIMRKKVSPQEGRDNPIATALGTATRALDKQQELYRQIRKLEVELVERDARLDAIVDVVEDEDVDFEPNDRLEEIDKILGGEDEDAAGEE
jgi:hypothetical protein